MDQRADVSIGALEKFREDLDAYAENQRHAIEGVRLELERTAHQMELRINELEREARYWEGEYRVCMASGVPDEPPPDCSGPAGAAEAARLEQRRVNRALGGLIVAQDAWERASRTHDSLAASLIPAMSNGLERRVTSLQDYWNWSNVAKMTAGLRLGGRYPRPGPETLERGPAGPETRG